MGFLCFCFIGTLLLVSEGGGRLGEGGACRKAHMWGSGVKEALKQTWA